VLNKYKIKNPLFSIDKIAHERAGIWYTLLAGDKKNVYIYNEKLLHYRHSEETHFKLKVLEKLIDAEPSLYHVDCFTTSTKLFLVVGERHKYKGFFPFLYDMTKKQKKEFLFNVVRLFKQYEKLGVVCVSVEVFDLKVSPNDKTKPLLFNLNNLYQEGTEVAVPPSLHAPFRDRGDIPELANYNFDFTRNGEGGEFIKVRAERALSIINVLELISYYCSYGICEGADDQLKELYKASVKGWATRTGPTWEQIEGLLRNVDTTEEPRRSESGKRREGNSEKKKHHRKNKHL